jgi:hypothetical protein
LFGVFARILPLALGVAASPVPVAAVIILLLTKRARPNSLVFVAAWIAGNTVAITVAILFAGRITEPKVGMDFPAEGLGLALIGVMLAAAAVVSRRARMRRPDQGNPPAWLGAVDNLSSWGGAVVAFSNATTSPKNIALALSAGLVINKAAQPFASQTAEALFYVAVASTSIVIPVALFFVGGQRAVEILERWKARVTEHASGFMEIAIFVIGVGLAVRGLYNLLT